MKKINFYLQALVMLAVCTVLFASCKKDKFTTKPQITFKSLSPNNYRNTATIFEAAPILKINLTDAEGDFGFSDGEDTSYVYVKNITVPPFNIDSVPFPQSAAIKRKDLNAEVQVDFKRLSNGVLLGSPFPPTTPYTDTLFFEIYVRDFANNKSNIIKTGTPLYYTTF